METQPAPDAALPPVWEAMPGETVLGCRRRQRGASDGGEGVWVLEAAFTRKPGDAAPDLHDVLIDSADESARVWVLRCLYRQHVDPAKVALRFESIAGTDVPAEVWERVEIADECLNEPDPVFAALDDVTSAQQALQQAEVGRVVAALAAWRVALAAEDDPRAFDSPYQRGFFTDLASRLKIASVTAKALVHTAADLEAALPRVWGCFLDGQTSWRVMQTVHAHLDGLDPKHHPEFDREAVRKIISVTPTGLTEALRRLRERLQARTADERHEKAAARRHVRIELGADGMGWVHAHLPAADVLALDHQLTHAAIHAAGQAGETRGVGQLKADVFTDGLRQALRKPRKAAKGLLVAGRRGVVPQVVVTIPAMTALGHSDAPARLDGYGTIGIKTALKLAGQATAWVRVLTDPITGGTLDLARTRYRPTKAMRLLLRTLDGGSRGPDTPRPSSDTQVDHAIPYNQDGAQGPTSLGNLALITYGEHRVKTVGGGDYDLLLDRTVLWDTSTGRTIITRPHEPLQATPVPEELIDDDCPF